MGAAANPDATTAASPSSETATRMRVSRAVRVTPKQFTVARAARPAAVAAGSVPDDAPVVFLCRSGHRSVGAADAAAAAGWGRTYNVLEGFEGPVGSEGHRDVAGWKVEGLPWRQT